MRRNVVAYHFDPRRCAVELTKLGGLLDLFRIRLGRIIVAALCTYTIKGSSPAIGDASRVRRSRRHC